MADGGSLRLAGAVRDGSQLVRKLLVERALPRGIEGQKHVVPGLGRGYVSSCSRRCIEREEIWLAAAGDGHDRVVYRDMQDREAAGWVNGRRLGARRVDDLHQLLVPIDNDHARSSPGRT